MGLDIAVRFIEEHLFRPRAAFMNFFYWITKGNESIHFEWFLLSRNIDMLLAAIFTTDHIIKEVIVSPQAKKMCEKKLRRTKEKLKCGLLFTVCDMHPSMFFIYEHVLFAKLIIRFQRQMIHEMAEEGSITHEDAHHVENHVLRPTEQALRAYTPAREVLKGIFQQAKKKRLHTRNDWFVKFVLKLSRGMAN